MIKQCQNCGKNFKTISNKRKYCSRECLLKSRAINKCVVCGKSFRAYHRKDKYCSKICAFKAAKNYTKKCIVCGKEFNTVDKKSKYCSMDCYTDDLKRPPEAKNFEGVCVRCGKKIKLFHKKDKYCKECAARIGLVEVKKIFEPRKCDVCGKIFQPTHYRNTCCSEKCKAEKAKWLEELRELKISNCVICGKKFVSTRHRKYTCSENCKKKLNSLKIQKAFLGVYINRAYKKKKQEQKND